MRLNKKTKLAIGVLLFSLYVGLFGSPHYSKDNLLSSRGELWVADGDTLHIGHSKFRFYGLDAPEMTQVCQDAEGRDYKCGEKAREFLLELIGDDVPKCYKIEKDKYNRHVGVCFNSLGQSLNAEMVKAGWAVAYTRYSMAYAAFELWARINGRGLWAGDFQTPEEYRHSK